MRGHHTATPSVQERAREELRNYALIAGYLYVCFGALLFYKVALLRQEGVSVLWHGLAAVKALILGKFLLLGEAVGVGVHARRSARTLVHAIVMKAVLLFLLLVVLSIAEEFVVGWVHGHTLAQTMTEFKEHTWLEMLAGGSLMLLILLPLVAARELNEALEPGALKSLLFSAPVSESNTVQRAASERR